MDTTVTWLKAAATKCNEALTYGKEACSPQELDKFRELQKQ